MVAVGLGGGGYGGTRGDPLIPMMRDAGYNVPRSAGLIASGGIIARVIPPSIGFVIFGVAANVSIRSFYSRASSRAS